MKKTQWCFTILVVIAPILFTSCATILGKSSYPFGIDSNPVGATVSITDKKNKEIFKGKTPATVILKSGAGYFSKAEYQVKLSAPGYEEQILPVNFKLNGWYFGNLLIGGLIGMLVIDPASGAMWKLESLPIDVKMSKSTQTSSGTVLKIIDIASLPPGMKDQLVRIR